MSFINSTLKQLFPNKWNLSIFIAYIFLFVNQGILVKASQSDGSKYDYNIVAVVIYTEFLKLIICLAVYFKNKSIHQFMNEIKSGTRIGLLYMIPAFLYCLYNNLAFINLANYDPTTYFILLQFRNVLTGLFFQLLFKKKLTTLQWFSLCLLTLGCIVKELGQIRNNNFKSNLNVIQAFSWNLFLMMIQLFCSCFAGVYNEYLLKDDGASVDILIQNIFMYCDSILCNLLLLFITGPYSSFIDFSFLSKSFILFIMINGALAGITTSFFLKNLNSIIKTFAATLEIILSAILCAILFDETIDIYTLTSILLIFIAIYIYTLKPIINVTLNSNEKVKNKHINNKQDVKLLLKE